LRLPTVVVSVALHVALGASLLAVAHNRDVRRRAISVAVTEAKKKAKPPKPVVPKPIVRPPAHKEAHVEPKAAAPTHAAKTVTPVAMNLAMSNDDLDVGPGIGLEGRAAPRPAAAAPAPAHVKVASAISERRTQQTRQEAGEQACTEEPSKPEVLVQAPAVDYSVYPQAQADGIEGKFKAKLVIAANGSVDSVTVVSGLDPAFDAAIVAALKRWRFKPAMACGKPVGGAVVPFSARFELGD
jgi:TonB family protein